jgi:regulatory protein
LAWGRKPASGKREAADGPEPTAYQRALGLLVRREHSRKELGRKLIAKGVDPEDLDLALETLRRQDFQNDTRFAAALARSRSSSGYGPARIRAELAQHGLSREDVAQALEACDTDWDASARQLLQRRYGGKDLRDPNLRRKAVDFLIRRGFEQRSAYAAASAPPGGDDAFD